MSKFISFLSSVTLYMSSSNSNAPHQAKEACLYKFQQFLECVLQSLGTNGDPKNTDKYFRVRRIIVVLIFIINICIILCLIIVMF